MATGTHMACNNVLHKHIIKMEDVMPVFSLGADHYLGVVQGGVRGTLAWVGRLTGVCLLFIPIAKKGTQSEFV